MLAKEIGVADRSSKPMGIGQDGVALLTVMMIMLILTVLGIAALTTTGQPRKGVEALMLSYCGRVV